MRSTYLVCYDVSDPGRLRMVHRAMRGFGDHVQLSVFRCDLSTRERAEMTAVLTALIDHHQDQVLVVDIGPADGRASTAFEALGRAYIAPERCAIIV